MRPKLQLKTRKAPVPEPPKEEKKEAPVVEQAPPKKEEVKIQAEAPAAKKEEAPVLAAVADTTSPASEPEGDDWETVEAVKGKPSKEKEVANNKGDNTKKNDSNSKDSSSTEKKPSKKTRARGCQLESGNARLGSGRETRLQQCQ